MRLLRDCAVILFVVGGVYFWKHRPVPAPVPAYHGARPDLRMPAASGRPSSDAVDSAQYVVPEDPNGPRPHLAGKARAEPREQPLGDKPQILGEPAVDVTAVDGPSGVLEDERSPWEERLRRPWAMGAVVALFFVLYALGTRALRKGPGGRGFRHD
jgi:hypothetical protein